MSREVIVVDKAQEPILYCSCEPDGSLEASFEVFGNAGQSDLEIIDVIYPSGFAKIRESFGFSAELHILDVIALISERGQGEKLKELIRSRTLPGERFSWMTDRD